mmetsp:Transcript_110945/g.353450  ORF Transcript_110945/g.353450 Transcript_110945/m.353450 type:complete len:109 (+) Transcript_110945:83-409(+)|eukprot:CAMPEP_0177232424 /NCGR_PEP_ID=MMETSP0367-20130122/43310_1 /TAXON_ID=447022 ORGANISM="Scrippsiella hangoei-like, Strain SHHI-4" /NCGR_SAMPLE_ID=MMETSP0367 /ASSEMBLY_ACC=CAM_ASM_000362 /LENGTH=108 /DNA_ID=CAMNT_0018683059 /DNA_START=81 /DNA_END=407 /DNA_ORIENTATION=-
MGSIAERLKDYHRTLKPKKGDELSMKQVAYFFGGLYAVIHLLQYFDLWTLLILGLIGYVLYRQAQNAVQLVSSTNEESAPTQQQERPSARPKTKAGKKAARGGDSSKD